MILVTGASGFIGQALCAELLRRRCALRGVVRSHSTIDTSLMPVSVISEISTDTNWSEALDGVEVVIHLAARVHMMQDAAVDPLAEFRRVNTAGTEHLARCVAASGARRMVYISSTRANGEETCDVQRFSETDAPEPQDPYGISKWEAEQSLRQVSDETGLEVVIVRPPLVYGPGVKGNFMSLLVAINKGIPLPLAGANNVRSLIYVNNLVDALIVCATHPAAAGQTYLVSDGADVSVAVLVKEIAYSLGRSNRSFYLPPALLRALASLSGRSDQIERLLGSLRVDDKKIRDELGWIPPYTLKQGLRATADWLRN